MEERMAISIGISLVSLVLGAIVRSWFNSLLARIKSLEKDLTSLKENLPKEYVLKDDHDRDIREIKDELKEIRREIHEGFKRLEEKLDKKADKQ
ncbi:hypothetical protein JCM9492_11170 [Aquifex pyrophilus]